MECLAAITHRRDIDRIVDLIFDIFTHSKPVKRYVTLTTLLGHNFLTDYFVKFIIKRNDSCHHRDFMYEVHRITSEKTSTVIAHGSIPGHCLHHSCEPIGDYRIAWQLYAELRRYVFNNTEWNNYVKTVILGEQNDNG